MNDPYARPIATAKRLIAKYGAACTWTKPAEADDAAKPWRDLRTGPPSPYPVDIAFFSAKDLGYGSTMALAMMAGSEVPAHSQMGLMAGGQEFNPELTDTLTFGADTLDVTKIDKLAPNGEPVLFFLWIA